MSVFKWIDESNENDQFGQSRQSSEKTLLSDLNNNKVYRWLYSPETIEELFEIEDALFYLANKIIFFHNKKPSVNNLLALVTNKLYSLDEKINILKVDISNLSLEYIRKDFFGIKKQKTVLLVDASQNSKSAVILLKSLTVDKTENLPAIWLYGNIESLLDCIPECFDALFIFDTSSYEHELVRKRIAISESMICGLRNRPVNALTNEGVILFVNYERTPNAFLLDANPKLLGLDISPSAPFQHFHIKEINMSNNKFKQTINAGGQGIQSENINKVSYNEVCLDKEFDLQLLSAELEKLSTVMFTEARDMDQRRSAGAIAEAERAAKEGDKKTTFEQLNKAGKWALQLAEKLTLVLVEDAIRSTFSK